MPGPYGPPPARRPIGVTILAVLAIIFGVLALVLGLLILAGSAVLGVAGAGAFAGLGFVVGGAITLFGLLWIVSGVGLLRLRGWAWWLAMIVGVLYLVSSVLNTEFVGAAISLIIVVYLVAVRRYFGIGGPRPAGV